MCARFCTAFLLAVFLLLSPNAASAEQLSPFLIDQLVGKEAPDFTLKDQRGQPVTLSSFRGRPVLLNFWAPWAPNSADEVAALIHLRNKHEMKELVILAITADKKSDKAEAFLRQRAVNYPVLSDPGLKVTKELYFVFMSPTTMLIDRNGIVAKLYFGQQEWLRSKMQQQLAEHVNNRAR